MPRIAIITVGLMSCGVLLIRVGKQRVMLIRYRSLYGRQACYTRSPYQHQREHQGALIYLLLPSSKYSG